MNETTCEMDDSFLKNRKNDEVSYEKMLKLKKDLQKSL